jgi:hypothetical protein
MKENTEQESKKDEVKKQVEIDGPVVQNSEGVIKVDLAKLNKTQEDVDSKKEEDNISETAKEETAAQEETASQEESVVEEIKEQTQQQEPVQAEQPILQEITEKEVVEQAEELEDKVEQALIEADTGIELPENIQKAVDFMNDTGGSLEDYVKLNTDYSALNETQLLREYYENTRPHLDKDEIDFLMEDNFAYDEELDEERDVRKKKIAHKEELAKAKNHLDGLKSRYYEDIKAGSKLNPEQQKAVEFFNRYNKEKQQSVKIEEQQKTTFTSKTNDVFNDNFKGFEYSVGDKKYRFNVKNANEVKSSQSDINNFVKKFLNEKNEMSDALGYHKSLFTAMNPDAVAKHFYEQGKSDAIRNSVATAKNVDMEPRRGHEKTTTSNGWTVKSVNGLDTSKLKVRIKK